jgi:hypothetical protein
MTVMVGFLTRICTLACRRCTENDRYRAVAGQQFSDICRILLTVHDPRIPAFGLDRAARARATDSQVRHIVRRICGTALSESRYPSAIFTAGMAIAMCKSSHPAGCYR